MVLFVWCFWYGVLGMALLVWCFWRALWNGALALGGVVLEGCVLGWLLAGAQRVLLEGMVLVEGSFKGALGGTGALKGFWRALRRVLPEGS